MFDYYDTLITPEEVADMLNCGMNTTYKLLKTGKIKAMRIGRVWRIPKRAVQDYFYVHLIIKHYFQATENPHGVIIPCGHFSYYHPAAFM